MSHLKPARRDPEHFDGLSLIYWTLMGPYGVDRAVQCMEFRDLENGLGVKVIGGVKEATGEEYGIYVKRIVPGGVAAIDGRLQPGDQILEVNGESLLGISIERAVDILRGASSTACMQLLITRDREARCEFGELMEKYGSHSNAGSARSSPVCHTDRRHLDSTSSGSSSRSQSPQLLSPACCYTACNGNVGVSSRSCTHEAGIQLISVPKSTGLGLTIAGGCNRPDGPMVYIQDIMPNGDCHRCGRLRSGDQLIAINKESLIGVTNEEAKNILSRTKFRNEGATEIAFIPGRGPLPANNTSYNNVQSPKKNAVNEYNSCRLKVHVRSPETRHEQVTVPSPSPDICPPELTVSAPASTAIQNIITAGNQKVALDPHVRLKAEKLDLALRYLGVDTAEERKRQLCLSLTPDSQGTVAFGDFAQVAKEMFPCEMEEAIMDPDSVLFTQHEVANLLDTSAFHSPTFESISSQETDEFDQLQSEVAELRQEIKRLKILLKETEDSKTSLENDVQHLNQNASMLQAENKDLYTKLQVSEAAQKRKQSAEQDFEGVIQLLEAEITDLKNEMSEININAHSEMTKEDVLELKKRLSVVYCQFRKSESVRKNLEASNRRLLAFVQNVHNFLTSACAEGDSRQNSLPEEVPKPGEVDTALHFSAATAKFVAEAKELFDCVSSSTNETMFTKRHPGLLQ
ncbi:syntaxin-binding protein 4-like [Protopterus annectens]|uniref:syntaxin-binding protein 4-like n=1 Tax=Protopterus annectens TaxID=7888 RepID=UPI001CFB2EB6|nr:syntaxin-binding protein 4-like [Protopterus annectens]